MSVAFRCFRRHTWTFQIKMWQLLRHLYYIYLSKSNYGSGGAWLLWSCIELQKGINPLNLLLCTYLERTAALILNEIAVLSAFFTLREVSRLLGQSLGRQKEANFLVSFNRCCLRCTLSACCAFGRSLKGHGFFWRIQKKKEKWTGMLGLLKYCFFYQASVNTPDIPPFRCSSVKESGEK